MTTRPSFGATDAGLLLMALIWGINYSVVKAGIRTLEPFAFNGLRVALAAVVLALLSFALRKHRWPPRRDVLHLLLLGVIGNGLYQLLFILGMARTRAGIAALVVAAGPAYIAIISHLLGRERLPLRGWAGIGLQLVGVVCVVGSTRGLEASGSALVGAAFIACGSLMWALFSVLLKPYTERAHPIHLSSITMASGAALLLVVATPALRALPFASVTPLEWGAVMYAGIGALVVAYLLFYNGVRVLGPTRTAMYGNLQPIIALSVAWVVLAERPTGWQLLGAALITGGLLLSRSTGARTSPVAVPAPSAAHS